MFHYIMNKEKHISGFISSCTGDIVSVLLETESITNFLRKNTFKKIKPSLI